MAYKSRAELDSQLTANITDNTGGENTASRVRTVHRDTIRSVAILEDAVAKSSAVTRVRVVDTGGADPASAYETGDSVDGVTLAEGDLVLRAVTPADATNGVYVVPATGAAPRHGNFAAYDDHPGSLFVAMEGTLAGKPFICMDARGGTLDTTDITIQTTTSLKAGDTTATASNIMDYDAVPEGLQTLNSEDSGSVSNDPPIGFTAGLQLPRSASRAVQIVFGATGTAISYFRSRGVSGWSAWHRFADLNTENQPLSGGVEVTSKALNGGSNVASGTLTLNMGECPQQHYNNAGAHILDPGSVSGSCFLDVVNVTGAGAIDTSGWTRVEGEFDTTVGNGFRCACSVGFAGSLLQIQPMQD